MHTNECDSDEEIFWGKLTLKEIKRHIFKNERRCTIDNTKSIKNEEDINESIKIIESHSEPDPITLYETLCDSPAKEPSSSKNPGANECNDESFLKIEAMVENLSVKDNPSELNNTLDVINFILNNPPACSTKTTIKQGIDKDMYDISTNKTDEDKKAILDSVKTEIKTESNSWNNCKFLSESDTNINKESYDTKSPLKSLASDTVLVTPKRNLPQEENFATPSSELKTKTPIFKTPGNPMSVRKNFLNSAKKTPDIYRHITSPIASYIKNGPQVPLIRDVKPKKPLPTVSSIPKLKRSESASNIKLGNKENFNLPQIAYKSAKKTTVTKIPDQEKFPNCQWAKKLTSSLPKPMIMKHEHREINSIKRNFIPGQEDSYGDLSLHQADVSVCTQKTAIKKLY